MRINERIQGYDEEGSFEADENGEKLIQQKNF